MNKIKIVNDEIKIINLNNSIEYEIKDNLIKTFKLIYRLWVFNPCKIRNNNRTKR